MSGNNYFEDLEKIANEISVEDIEDPMVEDSSPQIHPDEVEELQAINSEEPSSAAAEEQQPYSPEETEDLENSVAAAEAELEEAKEALAQAVNEFNSFEKTAYLSENLVHMGTLAKLLEYSTNDSSESHLNKLAQERLQLALTNEDDYNQIITKTAQELFEDKENLEALYSDEGLQFVMEQLASFSEDEELTKVAFEPGNIVGKVKDVVVDYATAAKDFHKLKGEVDAAKAKVDSALDIVNQHNADMGTWNNSPEGKQLMSNYVDASQELLGLEDRRKKGAITLGSGAALGVGGAAYGGKKVYDGLHADPEEELSLKTAGVKMYQNSVPHSKGGNSTMKKSVVNDFLKIAGAAVLVDIANNENIQPELRKEAATQFNAISRLGRRQMDEAFAKVATELYSEEQLHEVVAGYHNEELFDKIAFFTTANDMSVDELEKTAGADGVAAKGVAGALTDAKKNIEEKIEADKVRAESQGEGTSGPQNPGDTSS